MGNILDILEARGLLDAVTSPEVREHVASPVTVYAGFDPSSESLQIGNLVTLVALARFQRCGHRVIALVGGGTGMIGDPSGTSAERPLLTDKELQRNIDGIRTDLARVLDFEHPTVPARLVNNADWLSACTFLAFLRDVGKHCRMGTMLGKESVRSRLESESGLSFAEFSYQLLQAYDFLTLFDAEQCTLQLGGSDQWGNITAGIDLIRRLRSAETYGVTIPLLCDSSGRKFGKSEGNALFLSPAITSEYQFYQFFVRTADADVIAYLRVFTFLEEEEITELERQTGNAPEQRAAQKRLAEEVTRLVHGEDGLRKAQRASEVLFGGGMEGLSAGELLEVFADVPSTDLAASAVSGVPAVDVATGAGLVKSKGEARRLIESGGFYVNNRRVPEVGATIAPGDITDGQVLVLRSGKKNFHLVRIR